MNVDILVLARPPQGTQSVQQCPGIRTFVCPGLTGDDPLHYPSAAAVVVGLGVESPDHYLHSHVCLDSFDKLIKPDGNVGPVRFLALAMIEKENLEYVKEYYHSQTIKEMAARLNVSQSMIKYYTSILVQKGELQKRSKPKKTDFKDVEIAMIRQRYYRGDSVEEIAKELGIHQSTLRRYLESNGYNRSVKQIKHDKILYLYRLGYKYKEIAEKLDCTVPYVSKQVGKDADRNRKRQKEAEND